MIVLAIAGGVYWFHLRDASTASTAPAATTRSVAASLTTLEKSVSASGNLTPTVQGDVSFEASGTVTSVAVAAGQVVTAGQTLATIDTLTLNADLLSAKATLATATARLADSKDADDGSAAADAQIAANAALVDVAQAVVDKATAAMAGATLVAPVAGLLTEVNLTVGEAVTGSATVSTAGAGAGQGTSTGTVGATTSGTTTITTAQFVIIGTDSWEVDVTVDDSDVALIAVGDQAEITLAGADAAIFGTVKEIGLISTSTAGVAAFPVVVAVTDTPDGLHDGVSADVALVYERRTDVLTVPSGAVRTVDGTSSVSQADANGKEVTTVVTVGETVGDLTEIVSGLSEGDTVLVIIVQSTTQQNTTERGGTGELPSGFPSGMPTGGFPGGFSGGGQLPGGQNNG